MKRINPTCACGEAVRIQQRLDQLGLHWSALGESIDVTDQKLYYWRKNGVPKNYLTAVCEALNCSIDWLLTGRDELDEAAQMKCDKEFLANLAKTNKLSTAEWHVLRQMAESLIQRSI
ncbi:hypothetical protein [Marinobacter subterrani]|uniref:hypothetical protein n=1 Tax=Marinobacter subterrani TaxID=1658765 RepID=UPI002353AD1E|nr:hypothetical protein [Marinobacter subterrani]